MNALMCVCVMLCAGCVYSDKPDMGIFPIEPRPPIGPIEPWPPIGPIEPMPPIELLRQCYTQHGGWSYQNVDRQHWPVSTSPKVYYFDCKVWRPTWSSCKGHCPSSHNVTVSTTVTRPDTLTRRIRPPTPDSSCTCCRSTSNQIVRPYPRCLVIRIDHGQILSVNYETVRQRLNGYSYTLAGKCSCQTCGRYTILSRNEEVDEDSIVGRPAPPQVSDVGKTLTEALAEVPRLGGVSGAELFN